MDGQEDAIDNVERKKREEKLKKDLATLDDN